MFKSKSKSQTKRAIQARKWRINARNTRRLNVIISEYVRLKHVEIYDECKQFYEDNVEKYTQNQNLTKTKEFRDMMRKYVQFSDDDQEDELSDDNEEVEPPVATATVSVDETTTASGDEPPVATASVSGDETATASGDGEYHACLNEIYVEPGLMMNTYNIEPADEASLSEIVRVTIGNDIDNHEIMHDLGNIDDIINDIINDLQDVEADIFAQPEFSAEDEGIGLNYEDEIDYEPFDINLENFDF